MDCAIAELGDVFIEFGRIAGRYRIVYPDHESAKADYDFLAERGYLDVTKRYVYRAQ